jgi:hypothetical protein
VIYHLATSTKYYLGISWWDEKNPLVCEKLPVSVWKRPVPLQDPGAVTTVTGDAATEAVP